MLLEGTSLNDFATALLIRMRPGERGWDLALASAGHPPAVHVGREGTAQLGGGSVLGAWAEAPAQSHELTVEPGETIVLCTDGWLEAGPAAQHRDSAALVELADSLRDLALDDLTARLRGDVLQRSGGTLRDDVVVLAIRPAGEPQSSSSRSRTAVPLSDERI